MDIGLTTEDIKRVDREVWGDFQTYKRGDSPPDRVSSLPIYLEALTEKDRMGLWTDTPHNLLAYIRERPEEFVESVREIGLLETILYFNTAADSGTAKQTSPPKIPSLV